MFKQVITPEQQTQFEEIWSHACQEKGYVHEAFHETATRFLFYNENHIPIATVEILPFQPEIFTTINDMFPFDQHPSVVVVKERTYEIDKLYIKPQFRGNGLLKEILAVIVQFAIRNQISHFITMLDSQLIANLRKNYHILIEELGEKIDDGSSTSVPSLIDVSQAFRNKEKFQWMLHVSD